MLRLIAILITLSFTNIFSVTQIPQTLRNVGVSENLGSFVNFDSLNIFDVFGKKIDMNNFKNYRPKVFYFGYYTCPMLCHFVAKGVLDAINEATLSLGRDYDVFMMSVNPDENAKSALLFRDKYVSSLKKVHQTNSWHFLRGDENSIKSLTNQFGFSYYYLKKSNDFAHSAVIMILTPEFQISRYLYGVMFSPKDFKLSLLEASDKKVISSLNKLLLFCYNYDPQSKKYVLFARNLMKIGGLLTIFGIILMMFLFNRSAPKL